MSCGECQFCLIAYVDIGDGEIYKEPECVMLEEKPEEEFPASFFDNDGEGCPLFKRKKQ